MKIREGYMMAEVKRSALNAGDEYHRIRPDLGVWDNLSEISEEARQRSTLLVTYSVVRIAHPV